MIEGYYYLHKNGDLIYKRNLEGTVADLRDSDLVRSFWKFDATDRETAWNLLVEALSIGSNKERILELAKKWNCDNADGEVYADRIGAVIKQDGDKFCATRTDFNNLVECPAGFGDTVLEALADLCKQLGFSPTKLNWHSTFKDLLN